VAVILRRNSKSYVKPARVVCVTMYPATSLGQRRFFMPDVSTSSAHSAGFINPEEAAVPSSQAQHRVAILGRSLSREGTCGTGQERSKKRERKRKREEELKRTLLH